MEAYPKIEHRRPRRDDDEKPTLRKLMAAGERRLLFLNEKIDDRRGSPGSLNFDRAERLFLREAIRLMELQHAMLSDEHDPVTAIRNVLYQLEQLGLPDSSSPHDELRTAVARARTTIKNLTASR